MTHQPDQTPHQHVPQPGWLLDRKLSIGVFLALSIQAVGFVWWAATTDATVHRVTQDVAGIESEIKEFRATSVDLLGRVIRVEQQVSRSNELLAQILDNLQRADRQ